MAKLLGTQIYFAPPYSRELGVNENTNGLIRQYFPKRINFSSVTEQETRFIMNRLNNHPRKALRYPPDELFKGIRTCLLPD